VNFRNLRVVLLAVVLLPLAAVASAQSPSQASSQDLPATTALEQIAAELKTDSNMLGKFRRQKTMLQLPRPLVSTGIIALSQKQGISWRTLQPVPSHVLLGSGSGKQSAFARQIATPLMNILRGDFAALQQDFVVEAHPAATAGDQWKISLRPRSPQTRKYLQVIEIFGDERIGRIRLLEGSQALTVIEFHDLQAVSADDPQFQSEFTQP
jgi:hypothetical protein